MGFEAASAGSSWNDRQRAAAARRADLRMASRRAKSVPWAGARETGVKARNLSQGARPGSQKTSPAAESVRCRRRESAGRLTTPEPHHKSDRFILSLVSRARLIPGRENKSV